jgi:hypothetical protein
LIEEAMLEGRLSAEFRKLGAISFAAYRPFPVDAAVGDISFPWLGSDCAGGDGQSAQLDHLCTKSYWSDPIFELTSAAYVPAGSVSGTLTPGRLCIADESRAAVQKSGFLNNAGVQRSVAGSAEECIAMIQEGLVTAVIVPDVAAAKQNRQTPRGKLLQRVPGAEFSDTIHAVVDKANPAGERILKRLNDGIEKIRVNGEWYQIIQAQLTRQLLN